MDSILVEALSVGGPVAILAAIIFVMYRRDRKDTEKRWSDMVDDLIDCRNKENETREKHTSALTELITWLKTKNGR